MSTSTMTCVSYEDCPNDMTSTTFHSVTYNQDKTVESTETTLTTSDVSFVIVDGATGEEKPNAVRPSMTSPIAITVTTDDVVTPETEEATVNLVDNVGSTTSLEMDKERGTCEEQNSVPNNTPAKVYSIVEPDDESNVNQQSSGSTSDATVEYASKEQCPPTEEVVEDVDEKTVAKQSLGSDSGAPVVKGSTQQRTSPDKVPAGSTESTVVADQVTAAPSGENSTDKLTTDGANV